MGQVTLVGAGPGDPGLLTLAGRQALAAAEVVVYDRLVGAEILALIPEGAERIDVGKRSGCHPTPQEEISRILLEQAQAGKRVVRLKGGDCFLFGRGGEELELLAAHGVPFSVIPGVTSALAAPAYAGIPVTHRDCASSVHIITGHKRQNGELRLGYDALVRCGGTLVFLMSVATAPKILEGLCAAGMPPETPAAMVERGTLPKQRTVTATIATLARKMREENVQSPALLVVGEVCALAEPLHWFDKLPLHGASIAVTRPKERAGELTDRLRALGAEVLSYPCIRTRDIWPNMPVVEALAALDQYHWLVLTSPAGVDTLMRLLRAAEMDARSLAHLKIAAIGRGTADALWARGLRADFIPQRYDSAHLAEGLIRLVQEGERVLLLRSEQGSPELPALLAEAAVLYDDVPIYRTESTKPDGDALARRMAAGELDMVCFTSASTVRGFVESLPENTEMNFTAVCIGHATERAAREAGMRTRTAANATVDALLDTIQEVWNGTH